MSSLMPHILFVSGIYPATHAHNLAFKFEQYVLSLGLGNFSLNH